MKTVRKVSAFSYNPSTGKLDFLNSEFDGADPCYIINDEKNVIVANYSRKYRCFGK
jgi:6-phosphogluconolactonase